MGICVYAFTDTFSNSGYDDHESPPGNATRKRSPFLLVLVAKEYPSSQDYFLQSMESGVGDLDAHSGARKPFT